MGQTQERHNLLFLFIAVGALIAPCESQEPKPLDSKSAKTEYSFAVSPARAPFIFRVQIGEYGKIGDTLILRKGEDSAFQTLTSCATDLTMALYQGDEDLDLIEHADFNFDGFEDVKLLQLLHPHLGKRIFCVYLWDDKAGRFRYEPQIPSPDPIPHPEDKTITSHNEYFGGTHSDSVYVWIDGKMTEIASWGLANEGGMPGTNPNCPWTTFCYKRIDGEMRTVTLRPTGCNETDPEEATCTPPPLSTVNAPKPQAK